MTLDLVGLWSCTNHEVFNSKGEPEGPVSTRLASGMKSHTSTDSPHSRCEGRTFQVRKQREHRLGGGKHGVCTRTLNVPV